VFFVFFTKKIAKNTFSSSINTWTSLLHFTQQKLFLFIFFKLYKLSFFSTSSSRSLYKLYKLSSLKSASSTSSLYKLYKLSLIYIYKLFLQALQALQSGIYILFKLETSQKMNVNFSQAEFSQASGSRFHGNFNVSNDTWDALNMPLDNTPQISYTQLTPCTDFNASSDIPNTVPHILLVPTRYQLALQLLNLEFENI